MKGPAKRQLGRGPQLRRRVSFPLLVLYGLGTTVGAGVYALIGEVAGLAGLWAPAAFGLASLLACATALAFAELSSRHPKAAGEAEYVRQAFSWPALARAVGLAVVLAGIVSAAAVANGFAGYLGALVPTPPLLAITLLIVALAGIAVAGVRESLWVAGGITVLEVGGLLAVVAAVNLADASPPISAASTSAVPIAGIVSAATLAFYAFLGFEDMVNVAEEVKDVRRTLPRAILWTLALTAALYMAVAFAAVGSVSPADLAASDAPLALVYERAVGREPIELVTIGALAMINGALIQIVMASRVLYGLAERGLLPAALGRISARTGTPWIATCAVAAVVWLLAVAFPLAGLARVTALLALGVFGVVHASLFVLHRREPAPAEVFHCPRWVPPVGASCSLVLIVLEIVRRLE
ncbi:MAG: amino acid permease [Deltaproteobacteria bacterium]|nr:amino acid permease [Deltaproteobacteria bacterium]MBW2394659.1 amino acid permease [Deltaproteobacteria bacterium]